MCVWTKKRGSMNAVVLMATPCPKSLHGKGEKWIARNMLQGLDSRQPLGGCILNGKKQKASLASTKKKNASPRIMDEAESLAAICKPRPSSEGKRRSERMRLVQDKCLLTLS